MLDTSIRLVLSHADHVYPPSRRFRLIRLQVYKCYIASFDAVWDAGPAAGHESRDLCVFFSQIEATVMSLICSHMDSKLPQSAISVLI